MIGRYIPTFLRHAPVPGVQGFALLAGIEASVRGILVSVWPLVIYQALGDAGRVSQLYFYAGILSFSYGMLLPWFGRFVARRWLYSLGMAFYVAGPGCAIIGGPVLTPVGLLLMSWATMTSFTCINAYLMDFIARQELGRVETRKLSYSAASWTIGPMLGVWLWKLWARHSPSGLPLDFKIA